MQYIFRFLKFNWIAFIFLSLAVLFAYWMTFVNKEESGFGSMFFLSYFLLLVALAFLFHNNRIRSLFTILAALLISLLVVEYLSGSPFKDKIIPTTKLVDENHIIAGKPEINIRRELNVVVSTNGDYTRTKTILETGEVIFKMNVTTNQWGFRNSSNSNPQGPGIIFLGGSNTFGWTVSDSETLPSQFGKASGEKFRVENLGIKGGGSNQSLRALETGVLDGMIGKNPTLFVLETSANIMGRTACRPLTSLATPSYKIEAGKIKFAGRCFPKSISRKILYLYKRFNIFKTFVWTRRQKHTFSKSDAQLYIDINLSIAELAREKYGVPTVILYTRGKISDIVTAASYDDMIIGAFDAAKIPVIEITQEQNKDGPIYIVDGHYSALAHNITATKLVEYLSRK